jgi:glycerol-3-phosphate dehydrogenase
VSADLLVLGGGIAGCGIAREAALRGLSVVLVEKDDLAAGTSSKSTKLLHGGLRYLEHADFRLVREALREREATARMAPHLAWPLSFVLPARRGASPGRLTARIGVSLYDLLAGRARIARGGSLSVREVRSLVPDLAQEGLAGGVTFFDRGTDDARLTIAVARDAVALGAGVRLGVEVTEILKRDGRVAGARCRDREGAVHDVLARVVVNATGPWADGIRRLAGAEEDALRPTRGTHLVLPDLGLGGAVMLAGRRPGHRLFAIPWRGVTLFGTTDLDARDPDAVAPDPGDVDLLLDEARRSFPSRRFERASILSAFAGLRTLARSEGDTLAVSREHRILEEDGLLTLAGGKLTTWRSMSEEVVARVLRALGRSLTDPGASAARPLPGGAGIPGADDPRLRALAPDTRRHLLSLYGSDAIAIAAIAAGDAEAGQPILPGRPDVLAQVDFAARAEMGSRLAGVVLRRLPLGHDVSLARAAGAPVVRRLARVLGKDAVYEASELRSLEEAVARQEAWRAAPAAVTP